MVRAAIRFADYLSYRDSASKELIEGGRLRGFGPVFPDLAHSLPLPPDRAAPNGTVSRSRMRVGINPMPVYDKRYWYKTDDDRYQTYVSKLAEFADALVSKNIEVFFFPTQPKDINVAIDVIRALRPAIAAQLHQPEPIRRPRTVVELIDVIRDADIVVATRYHGTLLALHAGRPVIAICYQRKARDLMREAGQDAYAVDFDLLDVAGLIARVERLETRGLEEIAKIRQVNERYGAALDEQYRALIAQLLPEVSAGGQGVRPMPPAG
jgi:polysaccharide pyruvyl transferase WcaK-like protein